MKTEFNQREKFLLNLALQFAISNLPDLEDFCKDLTEDELEQLKNKVDKM